MDHSEDLRAQLDARIAARRSSGPSHRVGRHSPRQDSDRDSGSAGPAGLEATAEPAPRPPAGPARPQARRPLLEPLRQPVAELPAPPRSLTDAGRHRRAVTDALADVPDRVAFTPDDDDGPKRKRLSELGARLTRGDRERRSPDAAPRPRPPSGPIGTPRKPGRRFSSLIRFAVVIVLAAAFAYGLRTYVVQPFYVPSGSMETTLHGCDGCNDDRLLVDKLSYRLHAVHRGDVVVFRRPPAAPTDDAFLVKRVIGLPGETVAGRGGNLYIGSRVLDEPYVNPACPPMPDFAPVPIPAGDVFVMGDNRCDSLDSRRFHPVAESLIIGRAFVIVWPFARIHWL